MEYDGLAWREDATGLVVLRGEKPKGQGAEGERAARLDGRRGPRSRGHRVGAVHGCVVSEGIRPERVLGAALEQGRHEAVHRHQGAARRRPRRRTRKRPTSTSSTGTTSTCSREQMIRIASCAAPRSRRRWRSPSAKFVRLADDAIENVTPTADGQVGHRRRSDAVRARLLRRRIRHAPTTTASTPRPARARCIAKHLLRTMGTSPDSKWFLYLDAGTSWRRTSINGKVVNVDAATGKSFINTDNDHAAEKPIWGVAGWSKDGKSVLLYDKFDSGRCRSTGRRARCSRPAPARRIRWCSASRGCTGGGGRGGGGGFGGGGGGRGDRPRKPQTLTAYGEWTKKSGYCSCRPAAARRRRSSGPTRASAARRKPKMPTACIFTEQTFQEFPDYWVSDSSFASPRKITDANPQICRVRVGQQDARRLREQQGQEAAGHADAAGRTTSPARSIRCSSTSTRSCRTRITSSRCRCTTTVRT